MPSTRRSPRTLAVLLALCLTGPALVACSDDEPDDTSAEAPTDVAGAIGHALDTRAAAVRRGNGDGFARTLGGGRSFRDQQETWYSNLTQLPLERFRYRFDPASPFGGYKESGYGREGGRHGLAAYLSPASFPELVEGPEPVEGRRSLHAQGTKPRSPKKSAKGAKK